MNIQTMELDPKKVYTICVEVGDLTKEKAYEVLRRTKKLYDKLGIKAVYVPMRYGVSTIEISELP